LERSRDTRNGAATTRARRLVMCRSEQRAGDAKPCGAHEHVDEASLMCWDVCGGRPI